ncbi:MAG: molecular chaperone TorD family protein [Actinomycetota bacterium]
MSERVELIRALAVLAEEPAAEHAAVAHTLGLPNPPSPAEHTDVYVLQVYPFASVYVGAEGMMGGEARDRIAGFWRAVGQVPPTEPDHVAALLGLYAGLLDQAERENDPARRIMTQRAAAALLWEHLLSWLPPFLAKLREVGSDFHREWADLLIDVLFEESRSLDADLPLPVHLAEAPGLAEEDTLDGHLSGVLAPVRSGMVITRADLARGAVSADVGTRIGERRFILKAMLEQDVRATLRWLSSEATRWKEIHLSMGSRWGIGSNFWVQRCADAAELFTRMADSEEEQEVVLGVARSS